jgi:hypothetical protein
MRDHLGEELAAEILALEARHPTILFEIATRDALTLIGVLQLVLRHPAVPANARALVEHVKRQLTAPLAGSPALVTVIAMGDDPQFDS